jgi:hypothetical protein
MDAGLPSSKRATRPVAMPTSARAIDANIVGDFMRYGVQ